MNMKVSPKISVVTNIAQNNLDIHKSYDEYINSQCNIYIHQDRTGTLVLNYDNEITRKMAKSAHGNIIYFSSKEKIPTGVIVDDGIIKISESGLRRHLINNKNINLTGMNNYENICAAIAATSSIVSVDNQTKAIKNYKELVERL